MLYRKNVGSIEGWARVVAGIATAAGAMMLLGATPLGWLLAASGGCLALTGAFGFCPACALVGRKPLEGPR